MLRTDCTYEYPKETKRPRPCDAQQETSSYGSTQARATTKTSIIARPPRARATREQRSQENTGERRRAVSSLLEGPRGRRGNLDAFRIHAGSILRRSRGAMLTLLMTLTACIEPAVAFRGPHHPRSSVLHNHYVPEPSVKLTQNEELLHDATHLAEDMGPLAERIDLSKMSDQELEFYYFKVHDVDNNTKLDGLELLHALQHTLHGAEDDEDASRNEIGHGHADHEGASIADYSWIVDLIDRVLEEDDLDNDGYLGYTEYVLGRKKDQDERTRRNIKLKV